MQRVALSMRMVESDYGEWRDAIAQDWADYLHLQGLQPVLVPNDSKHCTEYLEGVSALILTGGDDIVLSGTEDESDDPRAQRDKTEFMLLAAALDCGLPTFGVCRGMQLLNVFFGGTLEDIGNDSHVGTQHHVTLEDEEVRTLFGRNALVVNSYHNKKVSELGKGLKSFIHTKDGVIEAIHLEGKPVWGVMWHPERTFEDAETKEAHRELIKRFLA